MVRRGDWYPRPELVEAEELREELLFLLDSIQALVPGDDWLLGQRVWYLSEARRWEEALEVARSCGTAEPWWCAALEGFSLHGLERYVEADRAFSIAIDRMDNEQALRWRVPRWVMDDDGQNALKEAATSSSEALDNLLERLWLLADPLYLVEGNDRKTSHYARWTVAKIREEAKNPYRISWGNDLDELTIRHGWELGWNRTSDAGFTTVEHVIGHKHPEEGTICLLVKCLIPQVLQRREIYGQMSNDLVLYMRQHMHLSFFQWKVKLHSSPR